MEQVICTEEEKAAAKEKAVKKKGKKKGQPGRPKDSKNRDKTMVELAPELQRIQEMVKQLFMF